MGLDIMYGKREREVTFRCLEGGMEWGTATGLAACGVNWNGDNKYTQSLRVSLNINCTCCVD